MNGTFQIMNGSRTWKKKTQQRQKINPYELNIITLTRGPIHGPKQRLHFKADVTSLLCLLYVLACVAFDLSFKNDTLSLLIGYALKCDCRLGLSLCLFMFV